MNEKIQKALAACVLLPAGFAARSNTFKSVRELFFYPRSFFSATLHAGYENLGPFARHSLRMGRRILGWEKGMPEAPACAIPGQPVQYSAPPKPGITVITAAIENSSVRVVSFDIFDTLLLRPVLDPQNVFALVASRLDGPYGIDFKEMRSMAEARLGKPNPTFEEIWQFIASEYHLADEMKQSLMEAELACEANILIPNPAMGEVFQRAKEDGKRLVAVSDMYLPADFLKNTLRKNGFEPDAVYVSCECGARKDDGSLFYHVLEAEGIAAGEMLHVGDNRHSDYEMPLSLGIPAIWQPSPLAAALGGRRAEDVFPAQFMSGLEGIYPGLAIAMLFGGCENTPEDIWHPRNLREFSLLAVAPLVAAFCASILDDEIQRGHGEICFAGRDGWLPYNVYRALRPAGSLEGLYFQAGRRAILPLVAPDFLKYVNNYSPEPGYTLEDFLNAYFRDADFYTDMLARLPRKNLAFHENRQELDRILRLFRAQINDLQKRKARNAQIYYRKIFAAEKPLLVDMGYSGSIGKAYEKISGKPASKAYVWQSGRNRLLDGAGGSHTHCFCETETYLHNDIMLEELFSPPSGGCTGFDDNGVAILERLDITEAQKKAHQDILDACLDYAARFRRLFGPQIPRAAGGDMFFPLVDQILGSRDSGILAIFSDIKFPDPVCKHECENLQIKLEDKFFRTDPFAGTGFDTLKKPLKMEVRSPGRIGVHFHLHYPELLQDSLFALSRLPLPFDLYLTSSNTVLEKPFERLARCFLPKAGEIAFIHTQNRGRDIAPWLVSMRGHQDKYDLFCHLHAKKSEEYVFGAGWRNYLFGHIIDNSGRIFNAFARNPELGCVVPPFYPPLREMVSHYPSLNTAQEKKLVNDLLLRLGYSEFQNRVETLYSAGTMLWYRPGALRRLFEAGLEYEDFEPEPIGVANSLAHALERLPCIVATRDGWMCRQTDELDVF